MLTNSMSLTRVFIFAHPDDEFGCFETIRLSVCSSYCVVCVYLTDGAFGGQAVEPRIRESERTLAKLGVARQNVHFVGARNHFPDGELIFHLVDSYGAVLDCLRAYGEVETLFAPAWEGGHQDHDASNLIALYVARKVGAKLGVHQYSLYNGIGLWGPLFRVMRPLTKNGDIHRFPVDIVNRLRYIWLCMGYPSQWKTWLALMPFVAFKLLFGPGYALQVASISRLDERPHMGPLLYERRSSLTWEQFDSCMRDFRALMAVE